MKTKKAFTSIKLLVVIAAITITVCLLSCASALQTSTSGKSAMKKASPKKLKRVDLTKILSPQVVAGNENNHYRDPTAIYHDGIFRLFFTVNQPRDNKKYMVSFLGTTTSRDLVNWTPVKLLTPEDPSLNYSSPGNIIRYKGEWIICFQTYPIGSLKGFGGDGTARLFIMRSKDLENWSEPELLKVKGPDVPRERMGRMIDPYLIKDKDEPGKWWCFYKQNGVSMSYSYDLKTWQYFGRQKAGENSCVLVLKDHYYLIHSPGRDGMGLMSSRDLKNWEPVVKGTIKLGYKVWDWAMARLTAGFALDLKENPRVGKYLMFYHGTKSNHPHEHIGICSLGIAWSDDLINWSWPKKPERVEQSGNAIFDGKTLDGWHAVPKECASDWTVRDGAIVGHGSADRLSYLVWKDEHLTDFELELRYRLPSNGNTGVEVRSQPDLTGKRPFEGYHADLGHVGIGPHVLGAWDFHFARRKEYPCNRGTRLVIDENGKTHSSTIPGALTVADIRPHQWNDVRIVARGNHFQFFINGKPASEFTDNAKRGRLDHGAIGLQIHDKGMHVEFKDLRLKRLPSASQPGGRVPVGLQKQLLVDDYVIAEKQNVTRELGKVRKHGIVLEPTLPTDFIPPQGWRGNSHYNRALKSGRKPDGSRVALDFGFYTTVLWNEKDEKFQMWYMPWRMAGVGYAESKDGIHWTKPLVGEGGKNNIVHLSQSFSCSIDPTLPWGHPEKYKAAFDSNQDRVCQTCLAYSSDGIHWSNYNNGKPVTHRAADCFDQILWDPIMKKYRLICRTDIGGQGGAKEYRSARIMVHDKGNDLMKHPTAWKTIADKITVEDPKKEKNPWGNPRLQFNWLTTWIYEGVYFAPMNVYTMDRSDFFDGFDYETRHEKDVIDIYVGTSRDGMNFDKSWIYARKPLVPRGQAGSFDKDGVFPPSQFVTHKDEHWIFYGAASERHYSIGRDMKIGLAKLRLDGFICLQAKDTPGTVITKAFKLEGDKLEVNIDAKDGWVRIELLDENSKKIPGFSGKAAKQYKGVDELRLKPQWKSGGDLSQLKGKTVRLRFNLRNARLYSFSFK